MLNAIFKKQAELMDLYGTRPSTEGERTDVSRIMALALNVETAEFMQELNWKPWKLTKRCVHQERVHEELIDCLHFLVELMLLWGLTPEKTHELYMKKAQVNCERQLNKY